MMKKFKWMRFNLKSIYYSCILFSLLVILLTYPSMINGEIGTIKTICLLSIIAFSNIMGTVLYLYWMKLIVYIEIDGKTAIFYDLNKRKYFVSFNEIERVVFMADKWVFYICNHKKLFAYRIIWRPYVKKDGVEHKDVLPTDFVGVRMDEDYSHI